MGSNSNFSSMSAMMISPAQSAPIPTQTFNAANLIGTPVPQVGDNAGRPAYASSVGNNVNPHHVVFVVIALFAIGYVLYHINFEE